jgi:3-deoxy-D-manno-octulosonic-acid transferase
MAMKFIYTLVIYIYTGLIRMFSLFNGKASLWVKGRRGWQVKLRDAGLKSGRTLWFHCASLGEFEQGRPVIEMIKEREPGIKIIITFFSPSGYEIMKNYPVADYICYLPPDTPDNAKKFISALLPELVIFVKYEFWNNYLSELEKKGIPVYLISGFFRPGQHFFKWYGGFFRKLLKKFTHIFVQDERSFELLKNAGIENISVAGDTRFDRVSQIASLSKDLPLLEKFRGGERLFLAGSSWKPDEEIIASFINLDPGRMKWVFAPHEIGKENIDRIEKLFGSKVARYSEFNEKLCDARVLIIDNIGILSSAYRYAYIAAIGGGFGKGIHNILEPACWGTPVLFGPDYTEYREAVELISAGGAHCYRNAAEFSDVMNMWLDDNNKYNASSETMLNYIRQNTGATEKIVINLLKKRY